MSHLDQYVYIIMKSTQFSEVTNARYVITMPDISHSGFNFVSIILFF